MQHGQGPDRAALPDQAALLQHGRNRDRGEARGGFPRRLCPPGRGGVQPRQARLQRRLRGPGPGELPGEPAAHRLTGQGESGASGGPGQGPGAESGRDAQDDPGAGGVDAEGLRDDEEPGHRQGDRRRRQRRDEADGGPGQAGGH